VRLMHAADAHIALMIDALFARGAPRVSLLGGLAEPLTPWLPSAATHKLTAPRGDSVDGALLIARRLARSHNA
jgi:glucosamine kinase